MSAPAPTRGRGAPDAATVVGPGLEKARVPTRALFISILALCVPLTITTLAPELLGGEYDLLIWLPALVPAFLLTYYRGWGGASFALAAGMATLVLSQVGISLMSARAGGEAAVGPDWEFILILVLVWVFVCLGVGWFGELLLRARRRAEAVALRDPLTGLPNRGHLRLFLDTAFGSAERGGNLTVIIFDLDHFKQVNDVHGHAAGDETLVAFAELLRKQTRRSDLSARFGGEEFVSVLTGGGGAAGAKVFADRVREAVAALPFAWGPVTCSAGVAEYHARMASPDMVLAEADRALYEAKARGRNQVVIAEHLPVEDTGPAPQAGQGRRVEDRERAPAAEVVEEGEGKTRGRGKGPLVLIVDDDEIMMEGVSRILRRAGFRTAMATDGIEALQEAAKSPPALILSDVVMPRMGGLTLADRIGHEHPGVRVLLMSGYEHGRVMRDVPAAVVGFVQKPMTPTALVDAVQSALASEPAAGDESEGPEPASDVPQTANAGPGRS